MSRLPAPIATKQDYERAVGQAVDLGLFSAGGSFERFPGGVLLAGRNGIVLAANTTGDPIGALLKRAGSEELRQAIDSALAAGRRKSIPC